MDIKKQPELFWRVLLLCAPVLFLLSFLFALFTVCFTKVRIHVFTGLLSSYTSATFSSRAASFLVLSRPELQDASKSLVLPQLKQTQSTASYKQQKGKKPHVIVSTWVQTSSSNVSFNKPQHGMVPHSAFNHSRVQDQNMRTDFFHLWVSLY